MAAAVRRGVSAFGAGSHRFLARQLTTAAHAPQQPGVIILGSCGALGTATAKAYANAGWSTFGIDIRSAQPTQAWYSLTSVKQNPSGLHAGDGDAYTRRADEAIGAIAEWQRSSGAQPRAVVCAAGGWMGGTVSDEDVFGVFDSMLHMCAWPVIMAGNIAARRLPHDASTRSVLIIVGAAAACDPTPRMLAYGATKAMTHFVTRSLGARNSGVAASTTVFAALPTTLDTAGNRAGMPDADKTLWVQPTDLAAAFVAQSEAAIGRPVTLPLHASVPLQPQSGSLYVVKQEAGHMVWEAAHA